MFQLKRALISVSDKTGIVDFSRQLRVQGVEILSTGGTAKLLAKQGIEVTEVADYTGFPELMEGRVKTLHPRIHGGLLGRRGVDDAVMAAHDIAPIDLLVVNLYPFEQVVADPNCSLATAIENIDIGGPAMLRAASKNHVGVAVVVNPEDYAMVSNELSRTGTLTDRLRYTLACKAFAHTAHYDGAIAAYLSSYREDGARDNFPPYLSKQWHKRQDMRYGENPHQQAAFYIDHRVTEPGVATAQQHQGKPLSYNNVADTDAALECAKSFDQPACVIVKHANPCGVAVAGSLLDAYQHAYTTDPTSAFGGIISFNQPLDKATAEAIISKQFVEVIIAPGIDTDTLTVLARKPNIRVLSCQPWGQQREAAWEMRSVGGGLLVQDRDLGQIGIDQLQVVSKRQPTAQEVSDLLFSWRVAKFVKSNAIVYARNGRTIGVGAGQMSRVYSARIAAIKAADEGLIVAGSVMASDAFFPFRDGIDAAAQAGITAVIHPGGSMRDQEVINAADEHGMAMVFTGMRHFRH